MMQTDPVAARLAMVREVEARFREVDAGPPDPRVLDAMRRVPRERFVPAEVAHLAYANRAVGIGGGQTISQPFIVALMTTLLRPGPQHRILGIGTGSGYQAAVLAELSGVVYTIERDPDLAAGAARVLRGQGYDNVETRLGDGSVGWPEAAPFDGVIVTAYAPRTPQPLVDQLRPRGRLVIPVGNAHVQELVLIEKDSEGSVHERSILPVVFVPLRH